MKLKSITDTMADERGSLSVPVSYQMHGLHLPRLRVRLHRSYLLVFALVLSAAFTAVVLAYTIQFFIPKQTQYSYSGVSCFTNPLFTPKATKLTGVTNFNITAMPTISVGSLPLYSHTSCITPSTAPLLKTNNTVHLRAFGVGLLSKKITISSDGAPAITAISDTNTPTSAKGSLVFATSHQDSVFGYRLSTQAASIECTTKEKSVTCPLANLQLSQGSSHSLMLDRTFQNQAVEQVMATSVTTLDPLEIIGSTIKNGQKVYESPTTIGITFSKQVSEIGEISIEQVAGDKKTPVAAKTTFKDAVATVTLDAPLARSSTFVLTAKNAAATDSSTLQIAYVISFTTSGGPIVTGTTISTYKVAKNSNISVNFDVELGKEQELAKFVSVKVGATQVAATVTLNGNVITINPTADLPHCSSFTVVVGAGLTSVHGVGGGTAWQYSSRTICQTSYSIGSSTLGRPITAYSFGTGPSKVLYVGGTHGNEKSSVYTLQGFIEDLELNYANIPAHRTVIVVPNLNPDAFITGSRLTSRGVDLNRNFEANNWQTDVYIPPNTFVTSGGGTAPLSEPESAAIAQLTLLLNPRLVLTYHAVARVVISNDAGDSYALAQSYGAKSAYPAIANSASHDTFEYDSTGEYEDWLHDKHAIPALLIELATMSSNEFSSQKTAMWAMVQLAD